MPLTMIPLPNPLPAPQRGQLRVGDLARYIYDPEGYEWVITRAPPEHPGLQGAPVGLRWTDADLRGSPYPLSGDYRLVARPPEGCAFEIPAIAAPFMQGVDAAQGTALDMEAVDGLADFVWGGGPQGDRRAPASWVEMRLRLEQVRGWLGPWTNRDYPSPNYDSCGLLWQPERFCSKQEARRVFRLLFANFAYNWGFPHMCPVCAADVGIFRALEDCEAHPVCQNCGQYGRSECTQCTDLRGETTCTHCCAHRLCSCGCGRAGLLATLCQSCGRVEHCCRCERCTRAGCRGVANTSCPDGCGQCTGHCGCARAGTLPMVPRPMVHHESKRFYRGLRRKLGTEIEIAGKLREGSRATMKAALVKWSASVVRDGSLPPDGVEIVTSPAGGDKWYEMMQDLGAGLDSLRAFVDSSCGNHVHVDATDLGAWDLRRVIQLYAHVEDVLFAALPATRRNSTYCAPCGPTYLEWLKDGNKKLNKRWLAMKQYGITVNSVVRATCGADASQKQKNAEVDATIKDRATHKYDSTRYKALNLHSFWHRGTIEFRHAHGTTNWVQILHWGRVCGSIVEFAAKHSDAEVLKLLGETPQEALLSCIYEVNTRDWLQGRWVYFAEKPNGERGLTGEI